MEPGNLYQPLSDQAAAQAHEAKWQWSPHGVSQNRALAQACHELLSQEFASECLAPEKNYVAQLAKPAKRDKHPIVVAGVFEQDPTCHVAAVHQGELLPWHASSEGSAQSTAAGLIWALEFQVTSPLLRGLGIKGVGRRLFGEGKSRACEQAEQLGAGLKFACLEAQSRAVAFWQKMGFLKPVGLEYCAPSLAGGIDDNGAASGFSYQFMVMPLQHPQAREISRDELISLIRTLYHHWYLAQGSSGKPASTAKARGLLLEQVVSGIPQADTIALD